MITPLFKLNQNENYLYVNIRAPYAKLDEVDVSVDENDFRFYCKPYYLRLNLPGKILDNLETEHGTYDFDERENFEGLDLLTKLLTPNNNTNSHSANPSGALIQEISETNDNQNENDQDQNEDDEYDWFIEQQIQSNIEEDGIKLTFNQIKYGFAQTKSNVFSKLSSEYTLIIDLPDPDDTPIELRTKLRIENENEKFDPDHYLADYFDDSEMIENHILKYDPMNDEEELNGDYTEKEFDCLKSLPKKNYLLDKNEKFFAFSAMIDILFSYCYNKRVNCGEDNVESGWTISKLSSTLSWFDTFKSLEDVLVACFRRSLTYPLYRNWKLSKAVLKDLVRILKKGRKYVIKIFLKIRQSFIESDCRYILNDLYINDYLVWLQYVSEDKINKLAECIEKIKLTKDMINLDLKCIELSGKLAMEDPEDEKNLDNHKEENLHKNINNDEDLNEQTYESGFENKFSLLNINESCDDQNKKNKPKIVELN